jgi:hypothetical protein
MDMTESEARPAVNVEEDRNEKENENVYAVKITRRTEDKTDTKNLRDIYLLQKGESATAAVFAAGRRDGRLLLLKLNTKYGFQDACSRVERERESLCVTQPINKSPLDVYNCLRI